jgi:hypothetical protein
MDRQIDGQNNENYSATTLVGWAKNHEKCSENEEYRKYCERGLMFDRCYSIKFNPLSLSLIYSLLLSDLGRNISNTDTTTRLQQRGWGCIE